MLSKSSFCAGIEEFNPSGREESMMSLPTHRSGCIIFMFNSKNNNNNNYNNNNNNNEWYTRCRVPPEKQPGNAKDATEAHFINTGISFLIIIIISSRSTEQ